MEKKEIVMAKVKKLIENNIDLIDNDNWKELIFKAVKEGRDVLFCLWELLISADKEQKQKNMDVGFGEEIIRIIENYEILENAMNSLIEIMFEDISDIIIPIELDGKKVYAETMELIKVDKETYQREKDIKDIEFINDNGVNEEKYQRVQKANMNKVTKMISYSQEITK
jgi:hypothetical protein